MIKFTFKNKGKFFITMFLSNIIIIFVTIIMLSFFFINTFENSSTRITNNYMKIILKQISYSANYMQQYISSAGLQMLIDADIIPLLYNDNPDYLQISRGTNRLSSYKIIAPYIDSIYVYNKRRDTFYSTRNAGLLYNDKFYDVDANDLVSAFTKSSDKTMLPRKLHDPITNKNYNVYTYVALSGKSSSSGGAPASIVINVSESWLRSMINEISKESDNNNIIIIDNKGLVVSHPSSVDFFMKNISDLKYLDQVLSAKSESGSFISSIDGREFFISYQSSGILGWKFISLIPQSQFTKDIKKMRYTLIPICIVMLLLSLVISFFSSLKIYNPLNNIIMNVLKNSPFKDHTSTESKDELKFLSTEFSAITDKVDHLNERQRENKSVIKNDLLKSLLFNDSMIDTDTDYTAKKLQEMDLEIDLSYPLKLVVFIIDDFKNFKLDENYTNISLVRFSIGNIGNEILKQSEFTNEFIDFEQDRVAFLLSLKNFDETDLDIKITYCIKQIQEACSKYLKISISAIISRKVQDLKNLSKIFKETLILSIYKKKYGFQCILTTDILNSVQTENINYPLEKEKTLTDAVRLGSIDDAKDIYLKMVIQWVDYPYNIINLWIQRIAFAIYNTLAAIEKHGDINIDQLAFIQNLDTLETLDDINAAFITFFDEISSSFKNKKDNMHQSLIEEIKAKILYCYSDENLSVTRIADDFNMSPVYISKVFKENTFETIVDFIVKVRINKSKELLGKKELSISEISEKIGLANPKYFYTFFKKNTGVTPSEYRRNLRI